MDGGAAASAGDGEKKKPPEGEVKSKRIMKTASQLELLEKTYAVEAYPAEALRAELSAQLGLSDRQLQMWFCHRRLKDRMKDKKQAEGKRQRKDSPTPSTIPGAEEMGAATEVGNEHLSITASGSSPFGHGIDPRRPVHRTPGVAVARIGTDMSAIKRYYEPQQSIAELRAIATVEAQLGEPLREDGPILGMEFDPLPPDAFGAPIVAQQKQSGRSFEANLYEQPDLKPIKNATRSVHEYQFLPQQPTARVDVYERVAPSYQYGSPADGHNAKSAALSSVRPFMHATEQVSSGYGFPSQLPSLNLLPQEGRQGHLLPSATAEYETVLRKSSLTNVSMDTQLGSHPITALENPFAPSDRRASHDEDVLRIERKRKNEEAKQAREVEANEKRIKKELEKQDILRRKREEQMKKEMERHDRERRKEEERLLREKQREVERLQREQRRELERRERLLQKESMRVEKMRQKEELRREKEAARQKAATERAIARRIAKESMELVEDERVELMDLAASSKGLPSIVSLDFETLQNLDMFRDKLVPFPPKSVFLKRPFATQPWNNSEENVGNLLMVWRFLITFTDVLGIWPFTMDEFVQAFHDYDPRLLGEVHLALLRTIIKDIEDVARTPASGLGGHQNSAANPGGGHPHIVEGAYAWGFNIRNWQRHLNPLTWPEILRQFALSAGFGPQLKKTNADQAHLRDDNEGNDGEDVITNLRSGAAVENAVAKMQERGFSNPRRSRHRLTPGTVKFAAFHVLSLEGSKGLTILEVAEKIQISGLRDLTTSKTPEASIAAALSRDSKLFERTAPSTYCVRPAYRKDPADGDVLLSEARERIRIFKSGFDDGEDADDAERGEEDSESDVADDPEVDDLGSDLNPRTKACNSSGANIYNTNSLFENGSMVDDVIRTPQVGLQKTGEGLSSLHSDRNNEVKDLGSSIGQYVDIAGISTNIDQEGADIDESNLGEPWVQGLMEGEYSDLTVEERLNSLVAMVGVALEGNSIRVVLEERLEAANALKKQIWAEAQLDKRRTKDDYVMKTYYSSFLGNKAEPNLTMTVAEVRQSPFVTGDEKNNELSINPSAPQEQLNYPQNDMNYLNNMPSEGNPPMYDNGLDQLIYQQIGNSADRSRAQLKSFIGHKAEEMYVYRSLPLGQDRRRNRYWQFITSASCNDPGCGRIFVELHDGRWRLIDSAQGFDSLIACLDVRGVRESHLHMMLQKVEMSFKEAIKRNILRASTKLQRGEVFKAEAVEMDAVVDCSPGIDSPSSTVCIADSDMSETSTSFTIELGRNETERNHALRRYQDFEKWMWKECVSSSVSYATKYGKKRCGQLLDFCDYCHNIYSSEDNHCLSCHTTYEHSNSDFNFSRHVVQCEEKQRFGFDHSWCGSSSPLRMRLLKLQLALIEVSILQEALQPVWTDDNRKLWGKKLGSSASAEDLLQVLTLLEGSMKRDYLSSNFETTSELLRSDDLSRSAAYDFSRMQKVSVLPWLPRTTAAVALRVLELDSSIWYTLDQKAESLKDRGNGDFNLSSKFAVVKNTQYNEATEAPHQAGLLEDETWIDGGLGLTGLSRGKGIQGRGRGLLARGGKSQRRVAGSRSESSKRSRTKNTRLGQGLSWKGKSRARGGRKHGRRSAISRQKPIEKAINITVKTSIPKEADYGEAPRILERDGWNGDETRFQVGDAENLSSSERSGYNDENGQASADEYDDLPIDDYGRGFHGKSDDLLEGSDYNIDADYNMNANYNIDANYNDEDDDEVEIEDQPEQGDLDAERYTSEESDEDLMRDEDQNGDPDEIEAIGSTSSDYSE